MVAILTQCATTRKDHTIVPANQGFMGTEKTAALVGSYDIIGLGNCRLNLLKPFVLLKMQMMHYKLIFHALFLIKVLIIILHTLAKFYCY